MKKILIFSFCLMLLAFTLTACGDDAGQTGTGTGNGAGTNQSSEDRTDNNNGGNNNGGNNSLGNNIGNAVDDIGNAVDDAVDDVADGLTGGFETYDDAYNHFMGNLSDTNEVRNSDKDLTEYSTGNQGYHFELHDTEKTGNDSKVGDFYVDSKTGKVYKSNGTNGDVSEYDFSDLR